jgi:hypothetical protein
LKSKYDTFETFKKWKAMVETEMGLKLKCMRSDNGGEYEKWGIQIVLCYQWDQGGEDYPLDSIAEWCG